MITNEPYSEERRLFGRAVSLDPEALAIKHVVTRPRSLGHAILRQLTRGVGSRDFNEEHTRRLFTAAVRDTYNFYECILRPDIDPEARTKISRHPRTVKRLVEFAMHADEDILNASGGNLYTHNNYVLSEDEKYITVAGPVLLMPEMGCPFAGNNDRQKVDPLFTKFADWGSRLVFAHHDAFSAHPAPDAE